MFVDTSAFVGLIDPPDQLHAQATPLLAELERAGVRFVTTELVLVELANAMSRPAYRDAVMTLVAGLRSGVAYRIIGFDRGLMDEAWKLFGDRPDKSWSLTDCFSFAAMDRLGIARAFTSDHHFEQAGFVRLMKT